MSHDDDVTRLPNGINLTNKRGLTRKISTIDRAMSKRVLSVPISYKDIGTDLDVGGNDVLVKGIFSGNILRVYINVIVAEETGVTPVIDIGNRPIEGGSEDAYLSSIDASVVGFSKGSLAAGAVTIGDKMKVPSGGVNVHEPFYDSRGFKITWRPSSFDWTSFEADVILVLEVPE